MKKLLFYTYTAVLFFSLHLQAVIFESDSLQTVAKHADKETLVIFDLDNTVMETRQYLGSDVWLCHEINVLKKAGLCENEALEKMLLLYYLIHFFKDMKAIQNAPDIISQLQKKGIGTIALTNRSIPLLNITIEQLKKIGIDFTVKTIFDAELDIAVTHFGKYKRGIIFCASNNKGKLLFHFFEKIGYTPKKIIYIDDKLKYVTSVETEAKKHGIPFIGIRFSGTDETKAQFDPEQTRQELYEFKKSLGLLPLD